MQFYTLFDLDRGHSLFFRNLVSKNLSPDFVAENKDFAAVLKRKKLPNCGVAALRVDFRRPVRTCITDVQLLFGTDMGVVGLQCPPRAAYMINI